MWHCLDVLICKQLVVDVCEISVHFLDMIVCASCDVTQSLNRFSKCERTEIPTTRCAVIRSVHGWYNQWQPLVHNFHQFMIYVTSPGWNAANAIWISHQLSIPIYEEFSKSMWISNIKKVIAKRNCSNLLSFLETPVIRLVPVYAAKTGSNPRHTSS